MNSWAANGSMRSLGIGVLTSMVVVATAMPALAHIQQGQAQGLVSGLLHPISGLDHVAAMVAVGIWGAQLGLPAIWLLPVVFPLVMAFGGFLGLINIPVPGVEYGIALSALLLGIAVALEARPSLWVAALLVGMFAIFHGHAHGAELPVGQSALMYSIGSRSRHGLSARRRYTAWPAEQYAGRQDRAACVGGRYCNRRRGVPMEGTRLTRRAARYVRSCATALGIFLAFAVPAHAHLVNTGLGPFYDGISHLLLSPEDLIPVFLVWRYSLV